MKAIYCDEFYPVGEDTFELRVPVQIDEPLRIILNGEPDAAEVRIGVIDVDSSLFAHLPFVSYTVEPVPTFCRPKPYPKTAAK